MIHRIIVISIILILTGCNTVGKTRRFSSDANSFFNYAVVDRDMRTMIIGDAGLPRAGLEQLVTRELNDSYSYLRPNFTTRPSSSEVKPYKVIFAMNPPRNLLSDAICKDPVSVGAASKAEGGLLQIVAVFCEKDAMSEVRVSFPQPKSMNDPKLISVISTLAWALMPQEESNKSDSQ